MSSSPSGHRGNNIIDFEVSKKSIVLRPRENGPCPELHADEGPSLALIQTYPPTTAGEGMCPLRA